MPATPPHNTLMNPDHPGAQEKDLGDRQLVARSHGLELRAVRQSTREADFIASTDAVDAFDEVVEQSWDLGRFLQNPVVLFAHQSRELPIGRATRVAVVDGRLEATVQFATAEMNPKAEQVFRMVEAKILNAVSVGFIPRTVRHDMRDGRDVYVLADNELHEISVVPIPANPEALAKMKAKARAVAQTKGNPMDTLEQVKAALAKRDAELDDERRAREALTLDLAAAGQRVKALEADVEKAGEELEALRAERDRALESAQSLRDQLIDAEVEALVGVKILPAEKDAMAALAKKDRGTFDALLGARPELKLLTQAVPTPTKASAPSPFADPSEELAARAERASE